MPLGFESLDDALDHLDTNWERFKGIDNLLQGAETEVDAALVPHILGARKEVAEILASIDLAKHNLEQQRQMDERMRRLMEKQEEEPLPA